MCIPIYHLSLFPHHFLFFGFPTIFFFGFPTIFNLFVPDNTTAKFVVVIQSKALSLNPFFTKQDPFSSHHSPKLCYMPTFSVWTSMHHRHNTGRWHIVVFFFRRYVKASVFPSLLKDLQQKLCTPLGMYDLKRNEVKHDFILHYPNNSTAFLSNPIISSNCKQCFPAGQQHNADSTS